MWSDGDAGENPLTPPMTRFGRISAIRSYAYGLFFTSQKFIYIYFYFYFYFYLFIIYFIIYFIIFKMK